MLCIILSPEGSHASQIWIEMHFQIILRKIFFLTPSWAQGKSILISSIHFEHISTEDPARIMFPNAFF